VTFRRFEMAKKGEGLLFAASSSLKGQPTRSINLDKRASCGNGESGWLSRLSPGFLLTNKLKQFRLLNVKQSQVAEVMSWMGKRSYATRLQRFGIERIREIARQNGKKGGRPRKEQKTTKL
jgi:hypothetical protein